MGYSVIAISPANAGNVYINFGPGIPHVPQSTKPAEDTNQRAR